MFWRSRCRATKHEKNPTMGVIAVVMWFSTYKPRVEAAARGGPGYPPPRPRPYG